jgi:hypothetical protein
MLPPAHAAALHHLDSHDSETSAVIRSRKIWILI